MSFLTLTAQTYPNTFLGYLTGSRTTTGVGNTALGVNAGLSILSGSENVAIGEGAMSQTSGAGTSQYQTAVGTSALAYSPGDRNTAIGYSALGQAVDPTTYSTAVGAFALFNTGSGGGGNLNTAIGHQSGWQITSGSKNSILGSFSGNQGGLDIRTASNYIVLSDGDGNPRLWIDNTGAASIPGGVVFPSGTANGVLYLNGSKVVSSGTGLRFDGVNQLTIADAGNIRCGDNFGLYDTSISRIRFQFSTSNTYDTRSGGTHLFKLNNSDSMVLNSTGLGIGTTPQRTLHVFTATAETQVMIESTSEQAVRFTRSGVGNLMFGRDSNNNFVFADGFQFSAATRLLTLTSTGNLGLGVTPSAARLEVLTTAQAVASFLSSNAAGGYLAIGRSGFGSIIGNYAAASGGGAFINADALFFRSNNGIGFGSAGSAVSAVLDTSGVFSCGYTAATDSTAGGGQFLGPLVIGGALSTNQTNRAVVQYASNEMSLRAYGATANSGFMTFRTGGAGADTEKMRLNASGNLGLGSIPASWAAGYKALQIGVNVALWGDASSTGGLLSLINNSYYDGAYRYTGNGRATDYYQYNGEHVWRVAPNNSSGSGAAAGFLESMRIDTAGNLLIATTLPSFNAVNRGNITIGGAATAILAFQTATSASGYIFHDGADMFVVNAKNNALKFQTNATERVSIPAQGGMLIGTGAIATNATDGFLYVPGCAGTPTGTPTTYGGRVPIVVDTTNYKLYFYAGGIWQDAGP
jgi:hypothetical protein